MRAIVLAAVALIMSACGNHDGPPEVAVAPIHGVRDPVCGMMVDPKHSPKSDYKGKTYYFCSREDKQRFDKAPAQFLQ
jgi:YHS domain-containing protein